MSPEERREFVRVHRTAILGYARRDHGPSMSVVYYVAEGDDILVSTMAGRAKAKAIARSGKVSLCVLDEKWPLTYLLVYCEAQVETDPASVVDLMLKIAGVMAGKAMPEAVRPMVEAGAKQEKRVVLRCKPYATFHSPPKHVHQASDINEKLVHGLGQTMPWGVST